MKNEPSLASYSDPEPRLRIFLAHDVSATGAHRVPRSAGLASVALSGQRRSSESLPPRCRAQKTVQRGQHAPWAKSRREKRRLEKAIRFAVSAADMLQWKLSITSRDVRSLIVEIGPRDTNFQPALCAILQVATRSTSGLSLCEFLSTTMLRKIPSS
jgi:hypothetical protein